MVRRKMISVKYFKLDRKKFNCRREILISFTIWFLSSTLAGNDDTIWTVTYIISNKNK